MHTSMITVRLTLALIVFFNTLITSFAPDKCVHLFSQMRKNRGLLRFRGLMALVLISLLTSSCYIPSDFTIDIRITQNGDYAFRFDGLMLSVPLRKKLRAGTFEDIVDPDADAFKENIGVYLRDLSDVKNFDRAEYKGEGVFYGKKILVDNFLLHGYFVFISRLNRLVTMQMQPEKKLITITSGSVSREDQQRMSEEQFSISGTIRLITDLPMVNHNAGKVLQGSTPVYQWQIGQNTRNLPFAVIAFDPDVAKTIDAQ